MGIPKRVSGCIIVGFDGLEKHDSLTRFRNSLTARSIAAILPNRGPIKIENITIIQLHLAQFLLDILSGFPQRKMLLFLAFSGQSNSALLVDTATAGLLRTACTSPTVSTRPRQ